MLGAGRSKTDDAVDLAVGVSGIRKIGEPIKKGEPLLVIHANDEEKLAQAKELLRSAYTITKSRPRSPKLIIERVGVK